MLAAGHAPLSYEDLDAIKEQGIDTIVNLCGEYCDKTSKEIDFTKNIFAVLLFVDDESRLQADSKDMVAATDNFDKVCHLLLNCQINRT